MEQQLNGSEQQNVALENSAPSVKTEEIKVDEAPKPTESIANTDEKNLADKKEQSPQEKSEHYQQRKKREFEDLKRQLAEKDRLLSQMTQNPPKDGEFFDPVLETVIPETLPAKEYQQLLARKMQQKQEQAAVEHIRGEVNKFKEKYSDAEMVLNHAAGQQLFNDHIFVAAAHADKGLELLYNLSKENPDELRRIVSVGNPYMQAVEFGNALAKYRNKPPARQNNNDVPPNPENQAGSSSGTDISSLPPDQQFRAKLALYRQKSAPRRK